MSSLWQSLKAFGFGILSHFWSWLPFFLLDVFDYWEKYLRPGILYFLRVDAKLPSGTLMGFAVLGLLWSAFSTYHKLRLENLELLDHLAPRVAIDPYPKIQEWTDHINGTHSTQIYITVRNVSAVHLRGVTAHLAGIDPECGWQRT